MTQSQDSMPSPVSTGPVSLHHARSTELELESPRRIRRARRRERPVCVVGESVGDLPVLTIQDTSDVQGAIVYDCRPPLLPVSLQLKASLAAPPWEDGLAISGVGPEGVAIPEIGVAPLVDLGTDLEDELSTPDDSPSTGAIRPEEVVLPGFVLRLRTSLILSWRRPFSILPMMVTPIVDPVVESPGTPPSYPAPPLPVRTKDEQIPVSETTPLREVAGSPVLDVFQSYMSSPAGSVYGLATSPISPSLREDDVSRPRPGWP